MRDKLKTYLTLTLWIVVTLGISSLIGNMTRNEIPNWYNTLAKPALNPPDFIFPIVWTTLYIMIAVAGWRIWRQGLAQNKILFALQMIMNWAWSYLFFYYHLLGVSFGWIIGLIICVGALTALSCKTDRITAWLLTPYLLWISFAAYLNFMIWQLN